MQNLFGLIPLHCASPDTFSPLKIILLSIIISTVKILFVACGLNGGIEQPLQSNKIRLLR